MVTSEKSLTSNDLDLKNINQSLENILANKIDELRQTLSMINEKEIKEILNVIKKSRIVQFAALGNTIV